MKTVTRLSLIAILFVSCVQEVVANTDKQGCILLLGGVGTPDVEYYQPDSSSECSSEIGTVASDWLDRTRYTSGCSLAETRGIVVREATNKPPVLYRLIDGTYVSLPLPYNRSDGSPTFTFGSVAASVDADRCISCGGIADGRQLLNQCYLYDTTTDERRWLSSPSLPTQVAFAAAVSTGPQDFYVVGGYDGKKQLDTLYHLDIPTGLWSSLPPMSAARWHHAAVALSSTELLVCGGSPYRADCELYDAVQRRWRLVRPLQTGRDYFSLVNDGANIYAIGGYASGVRSAVVERYDVDADRWTFAQPLKRGRISFVAAVIFRHDDTTTSSTTTTTMKTTTTVTTTSTTSTTTQPISHCILLLGGAGNGNVEYYHPSEGVECNTNAIGTVATDWLNETVWTSGCHLVDSKQIVVREAFYYGDKPPVKYNLIDGSVQELRPPYTAAGEVPQYITDSATSAVGDSKCLSCGGAYYTSSQDGAQMLNECYQYNSSDSESEWTPIVSLPQRLRNAASISVGGDFYLIGGYDGKQALRQVYRYNLTSQLWTEERSMSQGRYWHSVAVLPENEFLVCGGYYRRTDCEVYDTVRRTWRSVGSLAIGRMNFGMVRFQGHIYAMGGLGADALDVVERFDRTTEMWTAAKSLKEPRRGFVVVVV